MFVFFQQNLKIETLGPLFIDKLKEIEFNHAKTVRNLMHPTERETESDRNNQKTEA